MLVEKIISKRVFSMTENKLKHMLEKNKLDNLINNKSEAEKLCKLETTEEVLDLLKKYNYNETKEVFERELLEILQISLNEEELNSVTGGRISHRQKLAALLGVISLTGAINIPTEAASTKKSVSAVTKEKIEKKHGKNSTWMAASNKDKLAKTLAGIVSVGGLFGVGSLLLYKLLRPSSKPGTTQILEDEIKKEEIKKEEIKKEEIKKEEIKKDEIKKDEIKKDEIKKDEIKKDEIKNTQKDMYSENPETLEIMPTLTAPNEEWNAQLDQVNTIAVSLIRNPMQDYDGLVEEINREDLMQYALAGLELWCKNTKEHYDAKLRSITEAGAWNANFGLLMKVRWSIWLLRLKDRKITAEDLRNHVQGRTYTKDVHEKTFGRKIVWTERYTETTTKLLPKTAKYVHTIWPGIDAQFGSVKWTVWSIIIDALLEEGKMDYYNGFASTLCEKLSANLPEWWQKITETGGVDTEQPID